jgi:hypothetical protein
MARDYLYWLFFKFLPNDYKGFRLALMALELFKGISRWTAQDKAPSREIKAPAVSVANQYPISHLAKFT